MTTPSLDKMIDDRIADFETQLLNFKIKLHDPAHAGYVDITAGLVRTAYTSWLRASYQSIATAAQKELLDTLEGEMPDDKRIEDEPENNGYGCAVNEIRALFASHKARLQANDKEV
jgi:hypothetical protein